MFLVAIAGTAFSLMSLKGWSERVAYAANPSGNVPTLNVALLQPNIDQPTKLFSYYPFEPHETELLARQREVVEQMTALQETMLAQEAPGRDWDLVILPETAFVQWDFATNEPLRARIGEMARRAGADLALGAALDKSRGVHNEFYNSAYFVRADGGFDPQIYNKMRLVPFGETLPYFNIIPGFQENIVGIAAFAEGRDWTIFNSHGLRFGVVICFESTFSAMARGFVQRGADFLVVITNDAWYGLTAGAAQHHHVSLLRAVETRRWVARCANTGVSSLISPAGRAAGTLGLGERGFVSGSLTGPPAAGLTFFTRWGYAWLALPGLFLLVMGVRKFLARRKIGPAGNKKSDPGAATHTTS
jgi:apolipoprotein N-acyltransferase